MTSKQKLALRGQNGFSIVELLVAITITAFLSIVLVSFMVQSLSQTAVSSTRSKMASNLQTALIRVNDDIRNSMGIMPINQTKDPNAPSGVGEWISSSTTLVLATRSIKNDNQPFSDASAYDSVVYYVKDNSLYKRIIAYDDPSNREQTSTCGAATLSGGCPSDTVVIGEVTEYSFKYYTKTGDETTDPMIASSVKTSVRLQFQQSGQTISYADSSMMTPRLNQRFTDNAQFTAGLGGIFMSNSVVRGGPDTSIYSSGGLSTGQSSTIGDAAAPVTRINVANRSCGTNATFGASCAPSQPIPTSGSAVAFSSIYTNRLCAASQIDGTPGSAYNKLGVNGLVVGCSPSFRYQPVFDKAAHVAKMTAPTVSSQSCELVGSYGCTGPLELPANTRVNGSVTARGGVQVNLRGNLYVTGDMTLGDTSPDQTILSVDPLLTTRPIVVVNGHIDFSNVQVVANGNGITPIFVSFWSRDSTGRSQSDNYVTQDPMLIYDTLTMSFGQDVAIDLAGLSRTYNGSFYAYFGSLKTGNDVTVNGTVAGQRVDLGYNTRLNLTTDPWNTID